MHLQDIQLIFNRAIEKTFLLRKLAFVFFITFLCGIFVVFSRGLAIHANSWVTMSLTFLPFFLIAGVLLATGVVLIRIYHDEIKNKKVQYANTFSKSWEIILGASYFSIPMILVYLLLWMLLGVFMLLTEIPGIGSFFAIILAFAPFLLNLATLILCLLVICMLFFVTPIIALKGLNRSLVTDILAKRLKADIFSNILLLVIATLPLYFFLGLLIFAAALTSYFCEACNDSLQTTLQWFFIMIPFTALLSPAIVFFFNFAAESHVLINRNLKSQIV